MEFDLTKVLGTAILVGGAVVSAIYSALPIEVNFALVSAGMALWVIPPVWQETKATLKAISRD